MPRSTSAECSFYIPRCRDTNLSDGKVHTKATWQWLKAQIEMEFSGGTVAPGWHRGFYRDPDTDERVMDESRKYTVALPRANVKYLRRLLTRACVEFQQKMIYLSVAGRVEFVKADDHESD